LVAADDDALDWLDFTAGFLLEAEDMFDRRFIWVGQK
jgi:hypothetical protein